jgi:hypothetical protein
VAIRTAKRKTKNGRFAQDQGMIERLKDQLRIKKEAEAIHLNRRLLTELAFYPAHDKRLETPEYKVVHHKLAVQLDLPCLVCGVRNSTLKDETKNRYGAKQMETHHHIIEWALANAIDKDKFNAIMLPTLAHRHPDKAEYKRAFTDDDVRDWVDHSEDNLWVLCDVHHRAQYMGIHEITYPIWCPVDLLRDDFDQYVKEQIEKEKGTGKAKKSKPKKAKSARAGK